MARSLFDQVWHRASRRCEYCRMPQEFDDLTFEVEHIIPRKHNGPTVLGNLALACFPCNRFKGANLTGIDRDTGNIVPLFHPRRDDWNDHFEWKRAILIGKTPIGRATIEVLRINLPLRVTLRRELLAEGKFSP